MDERKDLTCALNGGMPKADRDSVANERLMESLYDLWEVGGCELMEIGARGCHFVMIQAFS